MADTTPRPMPNTTDEIAQQTQQHFDNQQYRPFYHSYEQHPQYRVLALSTPYQDYRRNQQQQREQFQRRQHQQCTSPSHVSTLRPAVHQERQRGLIAFARNARSSNSDQENEYGPSPTTSTQPLPLQLQPSPIPDWMLHPTNWIQQATTTLSQYLADWRVTALSSVYTAGTEYSAYERAETMGAEPDYMTCNPVQTDLTRWESTRHGQRGWECTERKVRLLGRRHAHQRLELARHRQRARQMTLEATGDHADRVGTEERGQEVLRMWGVKRSGTVVQRAERWEKRSLVLAVVVEEEEEA